jgi:hypothetical protein
VTPASISCLCANLDILHTTIKNILINDRPDAEEDTWYYDCVSAHPASPHRHSSLICVQAFDYSSTHYDVRLSVDRFEKSEGPSPEFTTLQLEDVSKEISDYPPYEVKICWFGKPPDDILLECTEQSWQRLGRSKLVTHQVLRPPFVNA